MKLLFMFVILVLHILKPVNSQGLVMLNNQNEENQQTVPDTGMTGEDDAVEGERLSTESLKKLYDVAKNISISKGIFMDKETKENSDDKPEVRRSVMRKVIVETESDVMKQILSTFKDDENKVTSLDQIEYMVHQYDVAVNFAQMGGFEILIPYLSSSDNDIAASVASVLGAAMQSNPTVQELAVKSNVGGKLLNLLSHKSPGVLSRVIFALASFLRNMPDAQDEFFAINGVSKLANILKTHQIPTNIKLKIINLFSDLSVEVQASELYPGDSSPEKISKRVRIFAQEMQICDICKLVPTFLYFEDYDTHEKIVSAMTTLKNVCMKDFQNEEIVNRIKQLLKLYDPLQDKDKISPVYPVIDVDLKEELHRGLISLLKEINHEDINKDSDRHEIKRTEL